MLRQLRTVAGLTLVGLVAVVACGDDAPNNSNGKGGTDNSTDGGEGGAGNATSKGGSSAKGGSGGKGGTSSKGGSSSKGGTSSKGGSGGTAGSAVSGGAGAGGDGPQCPACESGFCLDDGTCVDCLPSDDACPTGSYCTDDNTCVEGCKPSGDGCASGVCDNTHNCSNCISDDECIDDLVCGNGQCGAACTQAQEGQTAGCGDGLTCCSLHCTDVEVDSNHCGACGATCDDGEFCGIDTGAGGASGAYVTCHPVTIANICAIANAIVILDTSRNQSDGNRVPGRAIGAALKAKCSPPPSLSEAEQDSVEALNITNGRPVSGGKELLVVAGGPYYQLVEGYLEDQRIAPLYWNVVNPAAPTDSQYVKSSNDEVVLTLPVDTDHDSHDLFIIQFMRDPASGSLILNTQGLWLSGTNAAAYQLIEGMLPNLASFDKAWYAYEWTDKDDDKAPDLNEMELIDSGF